MLTVLARARGRYFVDCGFVSVFRQAEAYSVHVCLWFEHASFCGAFFFSKQVCRYPAFEAEVSANPKLSMFILQGMVSLCVIFLFFAPAAS